MEKRFCFDVWSVVFFFLSHSVRLSFSLTLYVLGEAKSQAVSWAHFHMARTSRVKPMSFGFSSPRISRCFMMAMNSLLLSSPFPGGTQWEDENNTKTTRVPGGVYFNLLQVSICRRECYLLSVNLCIGSVMMKLSVTHHRSQTERTPHHTHDLTALPWQQCGPPASW